jgi:hypothetical protein
LPATVKLLATLLETILCNLFSPTVAVLILSEASQNHPPFSADSVQGTGKNQLEPSQKSMENAPVMSLCSLLRNP